MRMYVDQRTGFGMQAKIRESGCNGAGRDEGSGLVRTVRLVRGGRPKIAWAGGPWGHACEVSPWCDV